MYVVSYMICVIIPCDQLQAWIRRTQASMVLHARFPKEQPERAHRLCACQKGIGQPTQSGWPWPPWVSESLSHNSFLSVYNFFGPLSLWGGYTSKSFFFTASGEVTSQSKQFKACLIEAIRLQALAKQRRGWHIWSETRFLVLFRRWVGVCVNAVGCKHPASPRLVSPLGRRVGWGGFKLLSYQKLDHKRPTFRPFFENAPTLLQMHVWWGKLHP